MKNIIVVFSPHFLKNKMLIKQCAFEKFKKISNFEYMCNNQSTNKIAATDSQIKLKICDV